MRRPIVPLLLAGVTLVVVGCGDLLMNRRAAWDNLFRDNNVEDTRLVLRQLPEPSAVEAPQNALERPLLAAVKLGTPPNLFVHDVASGETLWERELETIDTRPQIHEDLVVFVAGRDLHAWDLETGQERWRYTLEEGWTFRGAAVDSGRTFISIGKGRLGSVQRRDGRIICLEANSGARLWSHDVPFLLGAPAAEGGVVFVPWDGQNITVLDGTTGNEVARFRSLDDVIHFVDARPQGVFYGARGLYRLTEQSASGQREDSTFYAVPMEDAPGDPEFELSGYELPSLSMRKIRYFWRPEPPGPDGGIVMTDNAIYLLYFRFVFAFDATTGELRWAFRYDEDVEGAQVVPGGIYIVGRHGIITFIGAQSGSVEWQGEIGKRIRSITFALGPNPPPEREDVPPPDVRRRLQEVIFDPDNRLLPIRTYALHLLTEVDDPQVTQDLLEITSRDDVPEQLREAAAQSLARRDSGAPFLIDALSVHHDYLSQSRPVPLSIVARTLTEMEAREAVPALLEHLMDHETSINDLREVAAAVVALGDASIVGPLRDFLIRYHRDSAFAENAEPLFVMADGLFTHGHVAEQELLQQIRADANTLAPLREHINARFDAISEAEREEREAARQEAIEAQGPTPEEICEQQREEHYQLTQEEINDALRANAEVLRECFMAEMERNPETGQVRIVWLLTSEGEGINWDIVPRSPELLTCLLPHLRSIQFPCIRSYRQRARFGVNLVRPREAEPEPEQPAEPPSSGWGPPPPSAVQDGGVPSEEYPDEYPDELPGDSTEQPPEEPPEEQPEEQYPDELPE